MNDDLTRLWQIHGALASQLGETSMLVGASGWLSESATAAAHDGSLAMLAKKVDELGQDGRLGLDVRSGALEPSRWLAIAQTTWDGLADLQQLAGVSAFRFLDVWGEVVVPTAGQVADKAQAVGEGLTPALALVVVGLIALAVIKVS